MPTAKPFHTTDSSLRSRNGQRFEVVGDITKPDGTHDEEVLPMHRIRFEDGTEIEAWPDEIFDTTEQED